MKQACLKSGVSQAEISPKPGLQLAGYPHYDRANTATHDPLFASCLYLENGRNRLAMVSLDLLNVPKAFVRAVRRRVEAQSTIPGRNIMICCTHTHSGPLMSARRDMEGIQNSIQPDLHYVQEVEDKIVDIILQAFNNTFPAQIGIEKGYCGKEQGIGGNRRDPSGLADPEVWTIGIKDMENRWRACILKYALYPTVLHGESTLVSADYPGYMRKYLLNKKPGMAVLFLQGTSGDQSTRYFREGQTFEEANRIGDAIAAEADRVLDRMRFASAADLISESVEVDLDIRGFPTLDQAESAIGIAQSRLQALQDANAPYVEIRTAEVDLLGAENLYGYTLALSEGNDADVLKGELPAEIQVIGIGDTRLVGVQGELFVEFGLSIQAQSPFEKTFAVELANGGLPGYVCTKDIYAAGGYEAGTSLMTHRAGEALVNAAAELLQQTKEAGS